jgi:cobalamin biosynthesis protein CbiD
MPMRYSLAAGAVAAAAAAVACTPTVKLQAPDKPIVINLNVKIDQNVKIQIDKDLEDLLAKNPDLF